MTKREPLCSWWDLRVGREPGTTIALLRAAARPDADLLDIERLKEIGVVARRGDGMIELDAVGRRLGAASSLGGLVALLREVP